MNKKGTELSIRTLVVIILILLVFIITVLYATGQLKRIFEQLGVYVDFAKDTTPNLPSK